MKIWSKWGPFQWDIMASSANVNRNPQGIKLIFFSRYYDPSSKGIKALDLDLSTPTGTRSRTKRPATDRNAYDNRRHGLSRQLHPDYRCEPTISLSTDSVS